MFNSYIIGDILGSILEKSSIDAFNYINKIESVIREYLECVNSLLFVDVLECCKDTEPSEYVSMPMCIHVNIHTYLCTHIYT